MTGIENKSETILAKDTSYLALTELWCVFCNNFRWNWPRYNGTALYVVFVNVSLNVHQPIMQCKPTKTVSFTYHLCNHSWDIGWDRQVEGGGECVRVREYVYTDVWVRIWERKVKACMYTLFSKVIGFLMLKCDLHIQYTDSKHWMPSCVFTVLR